MFWFRNFPSTRFAKFFQFKLHLRILFLLLLLLFQAKGLVVVVVVVVGIVVVVVVVVVVVASILVVICGFGSNVGGRERGMFTANNSLEAGKFRRAKHGERDILALILDRESRMSRFSLVPFRFLVLRGISITTVCTRYCSFLVAV